MAGLSGSNFDEIVMGLLREHLAKKVLSGKGLSKDMQPLWLSHNLQLNLSFSGS